MELKIGLRTIKTAVGTAVSIFIAQHLGLESFTTGGMLTILCIQATRKQSIETAFARFCACIISIFVYSTLFLTLGHEIIVIGLALLIVIPISVYLKISGGIGTSSVVMLRLYDSPAINIPQILDLIILVIIGIGVALIINFYMPSSEKELENYQKQIEKSFQSVFQEMSKAVRGKIAFNNLEINKVKDIIKSAKKISLIEVKNNVLYQDDSYYEYFLAKEKQLAVIKRLIPIISSLSGTYEQSHIIADFLESISYSMELGSSGIISLFQLKSMRQQFKNLSLPSTMEEFETRAHLMQLVYELEQYLSINSTYVNSINKPLDS